MRDIFVTGGHGFVGKNLLDCLQRGGHNVIAPTKQELNLETQSYSSWKLPQQFSVVHLAARVGGFMFNKQHQLEMLNDNLAINTSVVDWIDFLFRVGKAPKRVIALGSVCAYPFNGPYQPDKLHSGEPGQNNLGYGISKRVLALQCELLAKKHNIEVACPQVSNLYGPGDNFNQHDGHLIPVAISKIHRARQQRLPYVTFYGNPNALRQFVFVQDLSRFIHWCLTHNIPETIFNLTFSDPVKISTVIDTIANILGYKGAIKFDNKDTSSSDVRDIKSPNWVRKAIRPTRLIDGLVRTVDWYIREENKK